MQIPSADKKNMPALAGVGLVALVLALVFTRGMTSSFDSVRYANVAHWLAAGEGISTSLTVVPVQEGTPAVGDGLRAFTIQPPGLPLYYALTGVSNRAASHALLHIVTYVALGLFTFGLGRQLTGQLAVGVTAALLTLLSPVLLLTVENYWTDLPAAALTIGALFLVIRSREADSRGWAWLLAASTLAALAVSLRLTALAFGFVLLVGFVLDRKLPAREQLVRIISGAGVFGFTTLAILGRNQLLAGSYSGTAPREWPMAPAYNILRAFSYVGSRFIQALAPGWANDKAALELATANADGAAPPLPGLLLCLVLLVAVVFLVRGCRSHAEQDSAGHARTLLLAFFSASLLMLVLPAGRHADFRVVEFRYLATLMPLIWLGVAAGIQRGKRPLTGWIAAAILVLVFATGIPGLHKPYNHSNAFMRAGLDWIRLSIPPETPVLSNGGKVLLEEDLTRRVYHISDWNFRHALGPQLQTDAGLLAYLRERGVAFVVLFGKPDLHKAKYWGKPIIGLFLQQRWQPWLAYRDNFITVYRIPAAGPLPDHP